MITTTRDEVIVHIPTAIADNRADAKRAAGQMVARKSSLRANVLGQVRIFAADNGFEVRFERYGR